MVIRVPVDVDVSEGFVMGLRIALCFLFGAFLSAWAGWWGMNVATDGNVKPTLLSIRTVDAH